MKATLTIGVPHYAGGMSSKMVELKYPHIEIIEDDISDEGSGTVEVNCYSQHVNTMVNDDDNLYEIIVRSITVRVENFVSFDVELDDEDIAFRKKWADNLRDEAQKKTGPKLPVLGNTLPR